jgi:hypothetical protein
MRGITACCVGIILLAAGTFLPSTPQEEYEKGTFSIYFMDEKVGYEEFTWSRDASGIELTVEGRITKPLSLIIEELVIRLDSNFIPAEFRFKGSVGGVEQDVESVLKEGEARNTIRISGQEQIHTQQVRRDAFLLPNPIFSPYMAITKKFRCSLTESQELSAYMIPQVETEFTLSPQEHQPCTLILEMGGSQMELTTDENGQLIELSIPLQRLRIVRD